ncbi:LysR family transcriptional regulator [Pseudomonas benzenivorans]|uniref:LysR family transcriptional regulator n=1 Tax=Pseudomonas benzenivorans TaxID=556533 RepID=A0ABY5H3Q7_9PSED|nr:LysR family transcriptional regulator [Pseudomonas benzenivorans]UTW06077.1 LysR family transcriptional regulator [Pseudomonas benzenivorans]
MNLKFLETLVWVARLKSFRLTAEKMFTTQASVSSRIAALEDELGTRLFLRDSKGVSLTPAGQKVLEYAEHMINTTQELKQSIGDSGNVQRSIRIGAIDVVINSWLSSFIAKVMERYPTLEIELTVDTTRNLSDQLQKGYLDVSFQIDMVRSDSVRNLELANFPVHWIVPADSLYHRGYASIAELSKERIITFSKNSRPHLDTLSLLHAANVSAPRVSCVSSVAAITHLIRTGFGVGLLPGAVVCEDLRRGVLATLDDLPQPPPLGLVATWHTGPGLELNEDMVALACEALCEYGAQMGEGMISILVPDPDQETP